ncbi:peptidoglycan-binding protein [Donghicola sp. C2-DW-16]|uniref:Peptidoglycan-binding protein n=1 Tax=Donghicola mangrovi TaxID=2729614 RepID=A0ABX2PEV3_9RHOB|nr:peptidoglycan-binding protein [Donghicola mangrovi]
MIAGILSLSLATNALADNDLIKGLAIGGVLGAIANSAASKQRQTTTTTHVKPRSTSSGVSSAQREANREVQRALNHFGFSAGTPDGVLGSNSRTAISQYQALLSFPVDGTLNDIERNILVTAYQRAMMGGQYVTQTVSTHPMGMRGLLMKQKEEALGVGGTTQMSGNYGGLPPEVALAVDEIARNSGVEGTALMQRAGFIQLADMNMDGKTDYLIDTSKSGSQFWCSAQSCIARVFASTPTGFQQNDFQVTSREQIIPAAFSCQQGNCTLNDIAPQPAVAAPVAPTAPEEVLPKSELATAPGPKVPNFFKPAETPVSVSAAPFCSKIAVNTAKAGGPETTASMTSPAQAIGEQFCMLRDITIDQSETLLSQIEGFTPQQIAEQCSGFADHLAPAISAAAGGDREGALNATTALLQEMGMSAEQIAGTARICLGVGYRTDNMPTAIASALALSAVNLGAYDEMVGHHLATGVGGTMRPDLAVAWYDNAYAATQKASAEPLRAPEDAEGQTLVVAASHELTGTAKPQPTLMDFSNAAATAAK